jgi:hypothetical protein
METNNNQKQTFLFQSKRTQRTHSDDDEKDVDSKKKYSPSSLNSGVSDSFELSLKETILSTDDKNIPPHRNSI